MLASATLLKSTLTGGKFESSIMDSSDLTGAIVDLASFKNSSFANADLFNSAGFNANFLAGAVWNATQCPDGSNSDQENHSCIGHLIKI